MMYHQLTLAALVVLSSYTFVTRAAESTSQLRGTVASSSSRNLGLWYSVPQLTQETEEAELRTDPQVKLPNPGVSNSDPEPEQEGVIDVAFSNQDIEETRADDTNPSGHNTGGFWYSLPRPEQDTIDAKIAESPTFPSMDPTETATISPTETATSSSSGVSTSIATCTSSSHPGLISIFVSF
jgi:hypothetical protein